MQPKTFREILDIVSGAWRARINDVAHLTLPRSAEEGGVSWHSFERWLVWEAFFACCNGLQGSPYKVLPEPMYRWGAVNDDEARKALGNRRADLLIRAEGALAGAPSYCIEFTLVQPGIRVSVDKVKNERNSKILNALSCVRREPNQEWRYVQVVVFHRIAEYRRVRAKTLWPQWYRELVANFDPHPESVIEEGVGNLAVFSTKDCL